MYVENRKILKSPVVECHLLLSGKYPTTKVYRLPAIYIYMLEAMVGRNCIFNAQPTDKNRMSLLVVCRGKRGNAKFAFACRNNVPVITEEQRIEEQRYIYVYI